MAALGTGVLSYIFKQMAVAAITLPLAIEGAAWGRDVIRMGDDGVPLTEGEADLIYSVFGDSVDTSNMRLHYYDYHESMAASVRGGSNRHIDFWGERFYSSDYSEANRFLREIFIHEATHIWQNQNNWLLFETLTNGCGVYEYELTAESEFDDFCVEQQAEIVGHYVSEVLYPLSGQPELVTARQRNLARVVEDQFPQAKITREKLESEQESSVKPVSYTTPFAAF